MQPVCINIQSSVWFNHAVKVKFVPTSTKVTKHAIVCVRWRRIWMHRPCNKTHSFSSCTKSIYTGTVESHFVMAPEHNAKFSQRFLQWQHNVTSRFVGFHFTQRMWTMNEQLRMPIQNWNKNTRISRQFLLLFIWNARIITWWHYRFSKYSSNISKNLGQQSKVSK